MSVSRPVAVAVSGRGLVDPTGPVLAADDEGFGRGRAAFETLRVYRGAPFRLDRHLARLAGSAERIGLAPPPLDEIEATARLALDAAALDEAVLRLYWAPGPPGCEPAALALVSRVPGWIEEARARGQRLVSLVHPRRDVDWLLPGTKSVSYAVNIAAELEAKRRGADDALLVDPHGIVLEGPVTNVWWREGTTLLTPSLELGILAGETRAALLELAAGVGYAVEEGMFPIERARAADEVFTSSSVREVMPIVELDDAELGRGAAAAALQAALRAVARGEP